MPKCIQKKSLNDTWSLLFVSSLETNKWQHEKNVEQTTAGPFNVKIPLKGCQTVQCEPSWSYDLFMIKPLGAEALSGVSAPPMTRLKNTFDKNAAAKVKSSLYSNLSKYRKLLTEENSRVTAECWCFWAQTFSGDRFYLSSQLRWAAMSLLRQLQLQQHTRHLEGLHIQRASCLIQI